MVRSDFNGLIEHNTDFWFNMTIHWINMNYCFIIYDEKMRSDEFWFIQFHDSAIDRWDYFYLITFVWFLISFFFSVCIFFFCLELLQTGQWSQLWMACSAFAGPTQFALFHARKHTHNAPAWLFGDPREKTGQGHASKTSLIKTLFIHII